MSRAPASGRKAMNDQLTTENIFFRYLLGQLSEEEQAQVEERFLSDGEYYQQLLLAEDELRCAYAQGSLSAAGREQFEKSFLIFPDERQRVELARAMISELATMRVAEPTAPLIAPDEKSSRWESLLAFFGFRTPATGFAVATAAIVTLAALGWMAYETSRLRSQVSQQTQRELEIEQQAAEARSRIEQLNRELETERRNRAILEQELAAARQQPSPGKQAQMAILSLILVPGRIRGSGETRRLTIRQDSAQVRILLGLGAKSQYRSYQAVILNSDGAQVWSRAGLRAGLARGARFVILSIPARRLAEDDYEINLTGIAASGAAERVSDYYFTVLRK